MNDNDNEDGNNRPPVEEDEVWYDERAAGRRRAARDAQRAAAAAVDHHQHGPPGGGGGVAAAAAAAADHHHNNAMDDDDDEDDDDEDDNNLHHNNIAAVEPGLPPRLPDDDAYDGGVALPAESGKSQISACDLMLFIECRENVFENHPILTVGVKVAIGLDKTTQLRAVFDRYVVVCNDVPGQPRLERRDLDFVHVSLLIDEDTPELAALMKNDTIGVRPQGNEERIQAEEEKEMQREMDQQYFAQLHRFSKDYNSFGCDVVLDCRGKVQDGSGLNQETLRTTVRGHSAILAKRCDWLGRRIRLARDELGRKSVVSIPDHDGDRLLAGGGAGIGGRPGEGIDRAHRQAQQSGPNHDPMIEDDEDDDGDIEVLNYHPARRQPAARAPVAQIENDEEEAVSMANSSRSGSPIISSTTTKSLLWVTIHDHSPDAVKLLLEYCYTNRVIPLGREAFVKSSNPRPNQDGGPIIPLKSQWPETDGPSVSFELALAGISLAEEAEMPRFSLMCEIAAVNTLTSSHIVEALTMCTSQKKKTGNPLRFLQSAVMKLMLKKGPQGVTKVTRGSFRQALDDKPDLLLPSLLLGTMDALQKEGITPSIAEDSTQARLFRLDMEDRNAREAERLKYRTLEFQAELTSLEEVSRNEAAAAVAWHGPPNRKMRRERKKDKAGRSSSRSRKRSGRPT